MDTHYTCLASPKPMKPSPFSLLLFHLPSTQILLNFLTLFHLHFHSFSLHFSPHFLLFMALDSQKKQQQEAGETAFGNNNEVPTKSRVTVVGSGNWGSVAAKLIASNTLKFSSFHGLPFPIFFF